MNACHVQLNGFLTDLITEVGSKIMQCGLCGWEALPLFGGAEGGVPVNTSQVCLASGSKWS